MNLVTQFLECCIFRSICIKPRVLAEKIRTYFDFGVEWKPESEHIPSLKKSETIYPKLYKTIEYNKFLEEMKKEEEENNKKNGI